MGLPCRMKIRIDAKVQPKSAAAEPRASSTGQIRGLRLLGQPEYSSVKRPRRRFLTRRHCQLDVIEADDFCHHSLPSLRLKTPESAESPGAFARAQPPTRAAACSIP